MNEESKGGVPVSRIGDAIRKANASGRLGLILCVIPGFPDLETYAVIRDYLEKRDDVTSLEVSYPASESFSDTVNDTIVRANQRAFAAAKETSMASLLRFEKTSFIQYYREAVDRFGFAELVREHSATFEGAILEWREEVIRPYVDASRRAGIELVQCVPVGTSDERIAEMVALTDPGGLVYVSCAPQAGGTKPPPSEIAACLATIRRHRPDVAITTAMGIRTPDDVRAMGAIEGVDAVVVGTAFMRAEEEGLSGVQRLLDQLAPALEPRERNEAM